MPLEGLPTVYTPDHKTNCWQNFIRLKKGPEKVDLPPTLQPL